jgi:hypothetical protein
VCHCAVVTRVVGDCFAQAFAWLEKYIRAVHDDVVSVVSKSVEPSALKKLRHGGTADATGPSELLVCGLVRVVSKPPDRVVLSWKSSPAADGCHRLSRRRQCCQPAAEGELLRRWRRRALGGGARGLHCR